MSARERFALRARIGEGEAAREQIFPGREAWALGELVKAGERGCTPIDTPGPRWSDYVFKLRGAAGGS